MRGVFGELAAEHFSPHDQHPYETAPPVLARRVGTDNARRIFHLEMRWSGGTAHRSNRLTGVSPILHTYPYTKHTLPVWQNKPLTPFKMVTDGRRVQRHSRHAPGNRKSWLNGMEPCPLARS